MASDEKRDDGYALLTGALDVMNRAIDTVKEKPLADKAMAFLNDKTAGMTFGVAVYASDPENPYDYYTVRLQNQRLELVSRGKDDPDAEWKVSSDYLRDVNDNADTYVENPLKLNWEWLKGRVTDTAEQ